MLGQHPQLTLGAGQRLLGETLLGDVPSDDQHGGGRGAVAGQG